MVKQKLHSIIKSYLIEIGNDRSICKTIKKVEREPNIWLGVRKGKKTKSVYFVPEIYFDRGINKKGFIFQVFDSQSKINKLIFGDIFTAILSNEISKIYFIFPIKQAERVTSIISVSLSLLQHKLGVKKSTLSRRIKTIPIEPSEKNIKNKLIAIAKKEKW